MKKLLYRMALAAIFVSPATSIFSQAKKTRKTKVNVHATAPKYVEHNLATPATVAEIKDISASDDAFSSVQNLVENNKVMLAYDDNTFHSKEPLRRGDFIISFNSALDALRKMKTDAGVDSNVINTFDRKRSGGTLTSADQLKDVKSSSIYYPAAKSLLETWGVAEPFLANKTLSPSSIMTEKEVYDILHNTLGYTSTAFNPYSKEITRGKFAIALNNAMAQKAEQIADMHTQATVKSDAEKRTQQVITDQQNKLRNDSSFKAMQMRREATMEAEAMAKSKSKKKKH